MINMRHFTARCQIGSLVFVAKIKPRESPCQNRESISPTNCYFSAYCTYPLLGKRIITRRVSRVRTLRGNATYQGCGTASDVNEDNTRKSRLICCLCSLSHNNTNNNNNNNNHDEYDDDNNNHDDHDDGGPPLGQPSVRRRRRSFRRTFQRRTTVLSQLLGGRSVHPGPPRPASKRGTPPRAASEVVETEKSSRRRRKDGHRPGLKFRVDHQWRSS